jgi:hypothetical protein
MTRRIRDFMNSTSNVDSNSNEYNNSSTSNDIQEIRNCVNFGVQLAKCEPSSVSFVSFILNVNRNRRKYMFELILFLIVHTSCCRDMHSFD